MSESEETAEACRKTSVSLGNIVLEFTFISKTFTTTAGTAVDNQAALSFG